MVRDRGQRDRAPGFVYRDLFALDAHGKELPARLSMTERTVRLEVEAAGAEYPVTVDPMWTQQASLVALDGAAHDSFGGAVSIDGDTALIGASGKRVGANDQQGQAYVFVRSGETWTQQAILLDLASGATGDYFGVSVALSGDSLAIGAMSKEVGINRAQGQAYIFEVARSPNVTACTMNSQCASSYCVDGLCCDSACGGGIASDCQSCIGAQTGGSDGSCAPSRGLQAIRAVPQLGSATALSSAMARAGAVRRMRSLRHGNIICAASPRPALRPASAMATRQAAR